MILFFARALVNTLTGLRWKFNCFCLFAGSWYRFDILVVVSSFGLIPDAKASEIVNFKPVLFNVNSVIDKVFACFPNVSKLQKKIEYQKDLWRHVVITFIYVPLLACIKHFDIWRHQIFYGKFQALGKYMKYIKLGSSMPEIDKEQTSKNRFNSVNYLVWCSKMFESLALYRDSFWNHEEPRD